MNKKSMTFNEFLGLIIALTLLFFLIIYPGSKIYASFSKQQYVNSYNKLVATIENIADSDLTEDSTDLILDENEKILFFNKDSNQIILKKTKSGGGTPAPGAIPLPDVEFTNIYQKLEIEECKERSCICLCKDCKADDKDITFTNIGNCKAINGIFDVTETGIVQMKEFSGSITIEGGFFLRRIGPKSRTVYIEKKNNNIGVCFQKPCIEEK